MSLPVSDETLQEILSLIEHGQIIPAIKVYRTATHVGQAEATSAIDSLRATTPVLPECETHASGSFWTLAAAMGVFAAILAAVYSYVLPRLGGETIPASAPIEIRTAVQSKADASADEHSVLMKAPDGSIWVVGRDALIGAEGFVRFRGTPALVDAFPRLMLTLSAKGRSEVDGLRSQNDKQFLAMIVNDTLIGALPVSQMASDAFELSLDGMSDSDANELFARLTQ
jgi:hypothetical protein